MAIAQEERSSQSGAVSAAVAVSVTSPRRSNQRNCLQDSDLRRSLPASGFLEHESGEGYTHTILRFRNCCSQSSCWILMPIGDLESDKYESQIFDELLRAIGCSGQAGIDPTVLTDQFWRARFGSHADPTIDTGFSKWGS